MEPAAGSVSSDGGSSKKRPEAEVISIVDDPDPKKVKLGNYCPHNSNVLSNLFLEDPTSQPLQNGHQTPQNVPVGLSPHAVIFLHFYPLYFANHLSLRPLLLTLGHLRLPLKIR